MIILGVDPGLGVKSATGVAMIDYESKTLILHDEIKVDNKLTLPGKTFAIAEFVRDVAACRRHLYHLDVLAIEYFVMRGKGGESLQRLIGAIISRFPNTSFASPQNTGLKKMLGGHGKAEKHEVALGVKEFFRSNEDRKTVDHLMETCKWDILDAMAVAITAGHTWQAPKTS